MKIDETWSRCLFTDFTSICVVDAFRKDGKLRLNH